MVGCEPSETQVQFVILECKPKQETPQAKCTRPGQPMITPGKPTFKPKPKPEIPECHPMRR